MQHRKLDYETPEPGARARRRWLWYVLLIVAAIFVIAFLQWIFVAAFDQPNRSF